MLRRSPALDALISRTKQQVLAATLLRPERSWYLLELARHLRVTPSSIQRELGLLVRSGILKRREDGNRVYFQADRNCPIFPDLRRILVKTAGLVDILKEGLAPLRKKIDVAFVYGSIASSDEHASSDVDLMVIGRAKLSELAVALRGPESRVGRSVNPTVYTSEEFAKKVREGNHFLNTVLSEELLFVYGTESDLATLAPRPAGEAIGCLRRKYS